MEGGSSVRGRCLRSGRTGGRDMEAPGHRIALDGSQDSKFTAEYDSERETSLCSQIVLPQDIGGKISGKLRPNAKATGQSTTNFNRVNHFATS